MQLVLNTSPLTVTRARLRPLARALAAAALLSVWPRLSAQTVPAQILPSGMQVVNGQASATLSGTTLTVRNTPDTILNWASFSIGAQNAVRFEQNNAQSQVLNRVTGNDPSAILGSLSSNGRVWLLNPNGVLFGADARVDVAGLVVSTLNLNDADWRAGRYRFSADAPAAVVNRGKLRSSLGGRVVLLGGRVENQGDITAPGGQIVLAGGERIELLDTGAPNLSVRLGVAAAGAVLNAGRIEAAGGRIDIHAASVNQQGIVRADALEQGPAGQIVLRATDQLELGAASRTSADGPDGGSVTLDGGASTRVSGALRAVGRTGKGGRLTLLGDTVDLRDGATLDVSGTSGGGQALIGGGAQGRDPTLRNASYLRLAPGASVRADALNRGEGGRIVLWSNLATRAYGSLSAHGGLLGGGGGWIETSGGWLDVRLARLDLSAPAGRPGLWLLDPFNILITDQTENTNVDTGFTATGNDATISSASLAGALNQGVQVVVSTAASPGSGNQAGDISVTNANINITSSIPGSLTLIADRDIVFTNSNISSAGVSAEAGPLPVTLTAGRSAAGAVVMNNSSISTQGGAVNINAGNGVQLNGASIDAGTDSVTINGRGLLDIQNSSISAGGPVRLWSDSIHLTGESLLSSGAQGDAIVLAGPSGTGPMTSFSNQSGSGVLEVAPEFGRWIVFNNDASAANFVPGGLVSDFTRYGAKANSWSTDTGNGFVFATDPTVVTATQIEPSLRGRLDIKPPGHWLSGPAATTDQRGMLDITQADTASPSPSSTATSSDFGAIAVSDMSPQALLAVLAARDRYKKNLLADAIQQLEKKPDLADLRPCSNPKETEEGLCLITPELQRVMQAATVTVQASALPGAALPEAAIAATAAARAAPAVTAPPAAAAAARVAAASAASALPAVPRHRVKAAALPQIRRKLALVIGVDRYADASIPPLANAVRDAKAMAHLFESTLGYDTLVLENASKAAVVRALNRMAVELGPNDSAIIYYAGHGELITSTQLGYWLLADSDARTATTWLSNTDISRLVGQIGASQVALISDSCYSGSLVSDERIRATPGQLDPDPVLAQRTVVVMSSGGNEPVFDAGKQGHSLFAWNLMQTLDQVARWQPGGRIFERVRFAVARALPQRPQYGAAKVIKHQPGNDYLFEQRSLDIGK